MAFPTSVNYQIADALVKVVVSSSGLGEDSARKMVETIVNHLASKDVLLIDANFTQQSAEKT